MSLSVGERLEAMACVVLSTATYESTKRLSPGLRAMLDPFETMVLDLLDQQMDMWESMPTPDYLITLLRERMMLMTGEVQLAIASAIVRLNATLTEKKHVPQSQLERSGRELLRERLTELAIDRVNSQLNLAAGSRAAADPIFDQYNAMIEEIGRLHDNPLNDAPKLPDPNQPGVESTGLDLLDHFCNGGLAPSEVMLHLAPTGGGKTTLAIQLAVEKWRHNLRREKLGYGFGHVYYFAFENVVNLDSIIYSAGAMISRESCQRLFETNDMGTLSTAGSLKPYEKAWHMDGMNGERERLESCISMMQRGLHRVDFSGANPGNDQYSSRGVAGIRDYIATSQRAIDNPGVSLIVVDYLGAMIDSMGSQSDSRSELLKSGMSSLSRVANEVGSPVFVAHQLNATQNKCSPGGLVDPKAAEGCGMLHERAAFSIASGVVSRRDGTAIFQQAKCRRGRLKAPVVCRLSDQFSRWERAEDEYQIVEGVAKPRNEVADPSMRHVPTAARFRAE